MSASWDPVHSSTSVCPLGCVWSTVFAAGTHFKTLILQAKVQKIRTLAKSSTQKVIGKSNKKPLGERRRKELINKWGNKEIDKTKGQYLKIN